MTERGDRHASGFAERIQPDCEAEAFRQKERDKKPYRRPTYRFERVFETMALSCGKISPVQSQCHWNRKNS